MHIAAHVLLKTFVFVAIGVARDCCCIAKVPRAPPIDEWRKQRTSCVCGVACPARRGTTPKKNDEIGQLFDQKGPLFSLLVFLLPEEDGNNSATCLHCKLLLPLLLLWLPDFFPPVFMVVGKSTDQGTTHTFITGRTFVWNGSFVSKK